MKSTAQVIPTGRGMRIQARESKGMVYCGNVGTIHFTIGAS